MGNWWILIWILLVLLAHLLKLGIYILEHYMMHIMPSFNNF